MRRGAFIGFALLALSYLAFANGTAAFAQAGSAGGTIGKQDSIGKQDKSISGGEEASGPDRKPVRKVNRAPDGPARKRSEDTGGGSAASSCQKIVGSWVYLYPPMNFDAEFRPDGSGTFSIPYTFNWRCSGGAVTVVWSTGGMNRIRILGDGNRLAITITECATTPMCHMGVTFPGARK
jgi:hypothetical protein